jgi:hypothetical protein
MFAEFKVTKWTRTFPHGAPQDDWRWRDITDAGPFKSTFNGPHDLDGGLQCSLCGTWHRYVHHLVHERVPGICLLVGSDCAAWLTGGLNCYLIEEEFKRSERRRRREAEEEAQRRVEEMRREAERLEREAHRAQCEAERVKRAAEAQAARVAEEQARRDAEALRTQEVEAAEEARRQWWRDNSGDVSRRCLAQLEGLEPGWCGIGCETWQRCENQNHFRRMIDFGLFTVNMTLYLSKWRPGHYRYILNVPGATIRAQHDYKTAQIAARGAFHGLQEFLANPVRLRSPFEQAG